MAKLNFKAGTTSKLIKVVIKNSSLTTGAGLTGLTSASSGLIAYYIKEGDSSATAITLSAGTLGTWSSGGFVEVDATHLPGVYEIGIPNAAIASGQSVAIMLSGATNMVQTPIEIQLEAVNNQDATAYGLSAVPISITTAIPTTGNTINTIADCLNAARAQGFGPWTQSGTTLTLYASDGVTAVHTFTLNSSTTPTQRT